MNGKSKMLRTCFTTAFATFAFLIVFNKVFTLHQLGSSPSSDGVEPGKSKFKLPTKAEREERGSQFHPQFKNYLPVDNEIANKIEKPKVASQIARRDEDMISSSVTNQVLQSDIHTLPKQLTQAAEVVVPKEVRKNPVVSRSKAFVELGLPNHYDKDYLPHEVKLKFKDFLNLPRPNYGADTSKEKKTQLNPNFSPIICPKSVEQRLSMPALSKESAAWCDWALSPTGGQVVVGKSWGNIQRNKTAKELFDEWNCNGYSKGINPSCDDDWGDEHMARWIRGKVPSIQCNRDRKSSVACYDNINTDRYCVFDNAQINFNMYENVDRPGMTQSRKFRKGFFSVDCDPDSAGDYIKFDYLYSTKLQTQKCDYVINGTTLMYSHDDIRNLGHTMNDIMNVWVMLWLEGLARYSHEITFLNIDSFNLGHNFKDDPDKCAFYETYKRSFHAMIPGAAFGSKTLCLQRVILQPVTPRRFVWGNWFLDNHCSFQGPSSMFQRWNFAVRDGYGLLHDDDKYDTNRQFQILIIVRHEVTNLWGNQRVSRNTLNEPAAEVALAKALAESPSALVRGAKVVATTFKDMSFAEQIELISRTSVIVGMHGAGITLALHMSLGTKLCCGVVEMYPVGEFTPIRGHGNMLRRMGVHYDRIDIDNANSLANGANIPPEILAEKVVRMLDTMERQPSCVLEKVVKDPFFEEIRKGL